MVSLQELHLLGETPVWRFWRGQDNQSKQCYLIKELTPQAKTSQIYRSRLKAEANFLKSMDHPRLLKVHNLDETEGRLIFEDAQCTLEQLLDRHGPQPNDIVAGVLIQCVEGLQALHEKGFLHGKLNARTVFVDPSGNIKLGNFLGYRKENTEGLHADTHDRPRYNAPEVIELDPDSRWGLDRCHESSDLYCLGYLALEMLFGANFPLLFGFRLESAISPREFLAWHRNLQLVPADWKSRAPQVAKSLADIIDGLLPKRPTERKFQRTHDLSNTLARAGLHSRVRLPLYDQVVKPPETPKTEYVWPTRRLGPRLHLQKKPGGKSVAEFECNEGVLVGNDPVANLNIKDNLVGPRHALLACQGLDWYAYDLKTEFGSSVNEISINSPELLHRGDKLRFGKTSFWIDFEYQGTNVIPGFDLVNRLHCGKGGALYLAKYLKNPDRQPVFCLRVFPSNFGTDQIRRFLRSIPKAKLIKHPNIVRLFSGGRVRRGDQETWYLAMEFLPRGSLRDLFQKAQMPLPLATVKRFGIDLAKAIQAASQHDTWHRNINPSCILFDQAGNAKLGDFLLAAEKEDRDGLMAITQGKLDLGDKFYQAPEILLERQNLNITCDLFGLAACMYEAVAGRLPTESNLSPTSTLTTLTGMEWTTPSQFNPRIPPEWDDFLQTALRLNPNRRFQTIEDFLENLKRLPVAPVEN